MRDEDVFQRNVQLQRLDLLHNIFAMIDRMCGPHLLTPLRRLLPTRRGNDNRQLQHRARDLGRRRTHATGAIDDQDGGLLAFGNGETLDEGFVGGDVGEWEGGCFGEGEVGGFVGTAAGVHELVFGVGAVADGAAAVEDRIADGEVETGCGGPDGGNGAGGVEADDLIRV